ncbi:MAG TPA: hypothetical protein VMF09_00710 [Solirubrobacteraceae bacterium]|nr:hypothetical protein [Solirubrobacteraceae bacterium]
MICEAHGKDEVGSAQPRGAAAGARGLIGRWLVLIGLLCALGIGAQSASAETLGGGVIASYGGTWTVHRQGGGITDDLTLTWSETYPVPAGETGAEPHWRLTSAHGEVKQEGEAAGYSYNCNATLSVNPAGATSPAGNGGWGAGILQDNVVEPAYSWPDYWTVWDLQPPVYYYYGYPNEPLLSSDTETETSQNTACVFNAGYYALFGEGYYRTELAGAECHFDTNPEVEFDWISFPVGTSNETDDNCEAKGSQGGLSWEATLKSKISFYSPGGPSPTSFGSGPSSPPPPPLPSQKQQAAQEALQDMRNTAIPNLERYCGSAAAGLLGVGAGVASGNAYLTVAGGLTAGAMNPFCGAALTRVVNDYKIHNDPALASIGVIARPAATSTAKLPSCKRYRGDPARFCKRLRSTYTNLDGAAQKVASIATAIEETVSRERAAYEQDDDTTMDAQNSNLVTLMGEEPSAAAAEASAGKDVAKVLKDAHIRFKLSKKQSAKGIALAESHLAEQGISTSELGSVDSAALQPAATDLLSDLEHL